jgi:hypothetical protein
MCTFTWQRTRLLLAFTCGLILVTGLFLAPGLRLSARAQSSSPLPAADPHAGRPPVNSANAAPPPPAAPGFIPERSGRSARSSPETELAGPEDPTWRGHPARSRELQRLHLGAALPGLDLAAPGPAGIRAAAPALAASPVVTWNLTLATVTGYIAPDQDIHLILRRGADDVGEARTRSDGAGFFLAELMFEGRWAKAQAGDVLRLKLPADTILLTAPSLTGAVTPGTDRLTGALTGVTLPAGLLVDCWGNSLAVDPDAAGSYTADLGSLVDIAWFHTVNASYRDANGNWITASFRPQNGMAVFTTYGEVLGATTPGAAVQVTLNHGGSLSTRSATADPRNGSWYVYFEEIVLGDVVTAHVGGADVVDTVRTLTAGFDLPADLIGGTGPANSQVSVWAYREAGLRSWLTLSKAATNPTGVFAAAFPAGTLDELSWAYVVHHDTAQADILIGGGPRVAVANWSGNTVWGYAYPGASLTAKLYRGDLLESAEGDASSSDGYYEIEFDHKFQAGDQVGVVGGGLNTIVNLAQLTASLDLAGDALEGQAPIKALLTGRTGGFNGFGPYWRDNITRTPGNAYRVELGSLLDVHNGREAWVQMPEGNDVDQPAWQEIYAYAPYVNLNETHNGVYGFVPAPNAAVELTLRTAGGALKGQATCSSDGWSYFDWQQFHDDGGGTIDIVPGDRVTVASSGWSQEVVAPDIEVVLDPATDRVYGSGPGNSFVEIRVRYVNPRLRVATGSDGAFMADFAGLIDLRPRMEAEAAIYDAHWNRLYAVGQGPYARANIVWDNVDGQFGPGVTVQYEVRDSTGTTLKGSGSGSTRPDGWLDGVGCGCDIAPGDRVHVSSDAGFDATLWPSDISGHIDVGADTVSGEMSGGAFPGTGNVWVWSEARREGYGMDIAIAGDGAYSADFAGQFDIQTGDSAEVWYNDTNDNQVGTQLRTLRLFVNYGHDWVGGETEPDTAFTVTVAGKGACQGQSDGSGNFQTSGACWNPSQPDIQPGDAVTVQAAGYTRSVNPVGTINGALDLAQDTVSGTIETPFAGKLRVRCEVWVQNGPGVETKAAANGGSYACDFGDAGWDLQPGQDVAVRYFEPDGDAVINVFGTPYARANVSWDTVEGWFGSGVSVEYTVASSGGTPKGGGSGTTRSDGWLNPVWCNCDMAPGDRVHVTSSAGFDATLVPIPITGQIDAVADRVSGVMSGGQFPGRSSVYIWSEGRYQGSGVDIDIAGDGSYAADFSGKFDIRPGDTSDVWYHTPDGDQVGVNLYTLRIEVAYDDDWVYAETEPYANVTIQVAGKATLAGQADFRGELRGWEQQWLDKWQPGQPDITPGDTVNATAAGWTKSVTPVGTIAAVANPALDTVLGKVNHSAFTEDLRTRCSVWQDNGPPDVDAVPPFVSPNGGSFSCEFSGVDWDVQPGQRVAVRVFEPDSDQFIHSFTVQPPLYLPMLLSNARCNALLEVRCT